MSEARRLRAVEEENGRLKRIVAQQALDLDALKGVLSEVQNQSPSATLCLD